MTHAAGTADNRYARIGMMLFLAHDVIANVSMIRSQLLQTVRAGTEIVTKYRSRFRTHTDNTCAHESCHSTDTCAAQCGTRWHGVIFL